MKKLLLGIVSLFLAIYIASLVYIGIHALDNTAQSSDAIVVLGARSESQNYINPCLVARVKKGVELYKNVFGKTIIMSGGSDRFGEESQAAVMKTIALENGVSDPDVILEEQSKNTYENLLFTKKILEKRKLHSVIIVSDPYHLPRASLLAKTLGLSFTVAPAEDSPCWNTYQFLSLDYFRDGWALLFYIVTGKISLL